MSLLMDALRKAEEAKKKAEQERESDSAPVLDEKPVVSAQPTPELEDDSEYDFDSFEQEDVDEDAADVVGLELEPKTTLPTNMNVAPQIPEISPTTPQSDDSQRDHESKIPEMKADETLSSDALADWDEETSEPAAGVSDDEPVQIQAEEETEVAVDQTAESTEVGVADEADALEPASQAAEPDAASATADGDKDEEVDELAALMEVIPEAVKRRAEEELALSRGETLAPEQVLEGKSANTKAAPKDLIKERVRAKTEKSARDRKSAKSVFAAKRPMQKARRNIQLAGMGIAALLVFGFGTYFYISIQTGGGMSVTIPADIAFQAVPNAAENGQFQDSAEAPEPIEPVVVVSEDPALAIIVPPLDLQVETNTSQTISQTIGGAADAVTGDTTQIQGKVTADLDQLVAEVPVTQPVTVSSDISVSDAVSAQPTQVNSDNSGMPSASAAPVIRARIDNPLAGAADIAPINLISFTRRQSTSTIDPVLSSAYAAYEEGELLEAERLYSQALANSPHHKDALLGLASLAASNGENTRAMELYSRLLARDPSDPVARASLLELMPRGSRSEQERELKRLADLHPDVSTLAYALGNFYASSQRWSDAQQMYFRALQLAKADASSSGQINPDYAFNLAISLEHLNQARPAEDYYQQALEFADSHPASFDLGIARSRLESIRGSL